MDYSVILKRYFAGETTLEEEKALKEVFRSGEPPEELREFAPWFQFLDQESAAAPSRTFDRHSLKRSPVSALKTLRKAFIRVAAAALIVLGIWKLIPDSKPAEPLAIDWSKYEVTDEKKALEITRAALNRVAKTLEFGAKTATGQVEKLDEITSTRGLAPSN